MTSNPLAARRATSEPTFAPAVNRTGRPYVHDLCDAYNARLTRQDIEWAVSDRGELYLRDRAEWTRRHTADLERKAEEERRAWTRNHKDRTP